MIKLTTLIILLLISINLFGKSREDMIFDIESKWKVLNDQFRGITKKFSKAESKEINLLFRKMNSARMSWITTLKGMNKDEVKALNKLEKYSSLFEGKVQRGSRNKLQHENRLYSKKEVALAKEFDSSSFNLFSKIRSVAMEVKKRDQKTASFLAGQRIAKNYELLNAKQRQEVIKIFKNKKIKTFFSISDEYIKSVLSLSAKLKSN